MNVKFQVWSVQPRVQGDHVLFYYRFFTFIRVIVGHLQFCCSHIAFSWYWINCWLKLSGHLKMSSAAVSNFSSMCAIRFQGSSAGLLILLNLIIFRFCLSFQSIKNLKLWFYCKISTLSHQSLSPVKVMSMSFECSSKSLVKTLSNTGLWTISLAGHQDSRKFSAGMTSIHQWIFFEYDFWIVNNPLQCSSIQLIFFSLNHSILLETLPIVLRKSRWLNGNVCTMSVSANPPVGNGKGPDLLFWTHAGPYKHFFVIWVPIITSLSNTFWNLIWDPYQAQSSVVYRIHFLSILENWKYVYSFPAF